MKRRNYFIISCLVLIVPVTMQVQSNKGLNYKIETSATVSGEHNTPFWLVANKHGLSSTRKNNAYSDAGIFRDSEKDKKFSYAFGLEMVGAGHFTSKFLTQQVYVDLRYRGMGISVGSKERGNEIKNDQLSSGSMTFSIDACPIPQARISIPEHIPLPWTKHWLHIKGHVAYGMFTDERFQERFTDGRSKYTKETLFHSKTAFPKAKNLEESPVSVELGIEVAAQFGGDCYYPDETVLRTPDSWKNFSRISFPSNGNNGASESDQVNILGNHVGSYNVVVGYHLPTWKVKTYWEHLLEDRSGMALTYGIWRDRLTGLEMTLLENPFVKIVVGEFLYTKHQSGALRYFATPTINHSFTGIDNYYNNSQYAGWEHWGQGIGNPLVTSPIYNKDGNLAFESNRVKGFHIRPNGSSTPEIGYRILVSVVKHWGTCGSPYRIIRRNQDRLLEMACRPEQIPRWSFTLAGAMDGGNMSGGSWGGMLIIRKTGLIGKKK